MIAWGETREAARLNLLGMLRETAIAGLQTNLSFLTRIIEHPAFADAQLDTGFIPRHEAALIPERPALDDEFWAVAGPAWLLSRLASQAASSPGQTLNSGWRSGLPSSSRLHLRSGDQNRQLDAVRTLGCQYDHATQTLIVEAEGKTQRYPLLITGESVFLRWHGQWQQLQAFDPITEAEQAQHHSGGLHAPMNGSIVRLMAQVGDQVEAGGVLLVLEAMKMEHSIRAPQAGKVTALFCSEGDLVAEGAVLVELEESE